MITREELDARLAESQTVIEDLQQESDGKSAEMEALIGRHS